MTKWNRAILRRWPVLVLSVALLALPLAGETARQYVTAEPASANMRPGGRASVILNFRVEPGFHINSNKPHSQLLIPTRLDLTPAAGVHLLGLKYSAGHEMHLSFDPGQVLNVYSGAFTVQAELAAAPKIAAGTYRLQGLLRYQACNDNACYPPKSLPVSVQVTVAQSR